jgi:Uma2 family endonuclease
MFAPQFVIEVLPPDDRISRLRDKMQRYIAAGVLLGWLIDPFERTVTIYRPNREPELLTNPTSVAGEGPVDGFVLDLAGILS